jgi:hypothetical protein
MRFDTRSTRVQLLALALAIGAAACAKKDEATTDNVAGGAVDTTGAVATPAAFKVSDVKLGKSLNTDKTIKDNADDFGVRDTIYASVKTEGSATGATLTARWTFQDNQVVEEQSQTINATGDAITEFHIMKATAWPKGNYKLAILLNGTEVETEDFEIK